MYEKILLPTDGSEASEAAIGTAIDLAEKYGATVYGLYVVDQSVYAGIGSDIDRETIRKDQQETGRRALETIRSAAEEADVEVVTDDVSGIPYERIVEYVEDNEIDLIVMSTHGRTGVGRLLLGSTTEKVLRSSPVPIQVLPAGQ